MKAFSLFCLLVLVTACGGSGGEYSSEDRTSTGLPNPLVDNPQNGVPPVWPGVVSFVPEGQEFSSHFAEEIGVEFRFPSGYFVKEEGPGHLGYGLTVHDEGLNSLKIFLSDFSKSDISLEFMMANLPDIVDGINPLPFKINGMEGFTYTKNFPGIKYIHHSILKDNILYTIEFTPSIVGSEEDNPISDLNVQGKSINNQLDVDKKQLIAKWPKVISIVPTGTPVSSSVDEKNGVKVEFPEGFAVTNLGPYSSYQLLVTDNQNSIGFNYVPIEGDRDGKDILKEAIATQKVAIKLFGDDIQIQESKSNLGDEAFIMSTAQFGVAMHIFSTTHNQVLYAITFTTKENDETFRTYIDAFHAE